MDKYGLDNASLYFVLQQKAIDVIYCYILLALLVLYTLNCIYSYIYIYESMACHIKYTKNYNRKCVLVHNVHMLCASIFHVNI